MAVPSGNRRSGTVSTPRVRVATWVVAVLTCGALLSAVWATSASATLTRPLLSSFGAFASVESIATDSAGNVYVYDGGAGTVYKFDASGNPVNFAATGTNAISNVGFAFSSEGQIAVDSSTGPAKGDIYVAHAGGSINIYSTEGSEIGELTEGGHPWGEACGVAVDSSGNVYVGLYPGNVNKYAPTANPVTNGEYVSTTGGVTSVCNLAADSAGDVFVDTWSSGPITRYEPSQFGSSSATGSVVDTAGSSLTVNSSDDEVFVDERNQISTFGPKGEPFEKPTLVFAGSISGSEGVAVNGTSNNVYASDGKGGVDIFGPPVVVPTVSSGPASNVAAETATVSGEINPEGIQVEECFFEYGETSAYGQKAPCAEELSTIGAGTSNVAVHADLAGLTAGTKYHYRLVAADEHGSAYGGDRSFVYLIQKVESEYAARVTATSAILGGSLNPNGAATEYFFEYGASSSYGMRTATHQALGETVQSVEAQVGELLPETTYHYRIVTSSPRGSADGADLTFTTEGPGGPLQLLDSRQWELVSPVEKYGAGIVPQRFEGDVIQAAEDGTGLVYMTQNPIENEPEGNRAPEPSQILARRLPGGGWSNRTMTTASESSHGLPIGLGTEYKLFSPDLSSADMQPTSLQPLASDVTQRTPYLRSEAACGEKSTNCFTPILTAQDTAPGAEWDRAPEDVPYEVEFVDASKDTTHVLLKASVPLLEGASERGIYEWSDGHLELVSVNAAGESVRGEPGGNSGLNERGAISNDGKRIFFCAAEYFGCEYEGALYMRDTGRQESVRLDPAESISREFQIASEDGSRAFLTYSTFDESTFTYSTHLMACEFVEVGGKLTCVRTEIASEPVGSVLGIDSGGDVIYFVSKAALAGEAVMGKDNLYVDRLEGGKWEPTFIVALSPEDELDWATHFTGHAEIDKLTSRVSPNGQFVAFMSDRSLTGYDNHDAVSGEPDQEVFLYDGQTRKLSCASCNPTGARPNGLYYSGGLNRALVNNQDIWEGVWVAASVPGWDNIGLSNAIHQTSYLSNEGRLFFNTSDALVPQDSNGLVDVYEYEPDGTGSCGSEDGCVGLTSSGTARAESVFLDASASGEDAFFITTAQLSGKDRDTAYDVYDAHVCTTAVPCEQAQASPPPCSSGESCKPAPTPQPSIYGAPASATFDGAGNPTVPTVTLRSKAKPLTLAQHLAKALKTCRKDKAKSKRSSCEKRARKRYGPKTKATAKSHNAKAHKGGK